MVLPEEGGRFRGRRIHRSRRAQTSNELHPQLHLAAADHIAQVLPVESGVLKLDASIETVSEAEAKGVPVVQAGSWHRMGNHSVENNAGVRLGDLPHPALVARKPVARRSRPGPFRRASLEARAYRRTCPGNGRLPTIFGRGVRAAGAGLPACALRITLRFNVGTRARQQRRVALHRSFRRKVRDSRFPQYGGGDKLSMH